jgi:hypothetical protein
MIRVDLSLLHGWEEGLSKHLFYKQSLESSNRRNETQNAPSINVAEAKTVALRPKTNEVKHSERCVFGVGV